MKKPVLCVVLSIFKIENNNVLNQQKNQMIFVFEKYFKIICLVLFHQKQLVFCPIHEKKLRFSQTFRFQGSFQRV